MITFRTFTDIDLPEFRAWFNDAELSRRISFPTDEWFAYVTAGKMAQCWVAVQQKKMIAALQIDRENREDKVLGYFDIAVRPDLRRRGLGVAVLSAFLSGPGQAYSILEGRIESDNAASLACCRRCGFELSPTIDEDGFIQAVFRHENSTL